MASKLARRIERLEAVYGVGGELIALKEGDPIPDHATPDDHIMRIVYKIVPTPIWPKDAAPSD